MNKTNIKLKLEDRKLEHIELALDSKINNSLIDKRFYYEPLFSNNKTNENPYCFEWFGKKIKTPIWVSSMTGGNPLAKKINTNIARACNEFGMGMSLGSCRALLENKKLINQFNVRKILGKNCPLFANLGIAQIEKFLHNGKISLINSMISELDADGLVIHINLLQEFLQPEGDIINFPPLDTIKEFIKKFNYPIIIKEVGQGMGPKSIESLLTLPIEAFEFAAFGGTNFSKLEIKRIKDENSGYIPLSFIGHDAEEMIQFTNNIIDKLGDNIKCKKFIISGGIKNFLDGFYAINKLKLPAIYGQASEILKYAKNDYKLLYNYLNTQIKGLTLSNKLLKIR